ncbi:hypothetical protein LTS10_008104 [Elasticomyces elasticus]|nr:hypothetical protein LTS10_008104 [Elasticomyces elasticus]
MIPEQGDWIVVASVQETTVELEWWTKRIVHRATYYVDKCYYGKPVPKDEKADNPPDFKNFGFEGDPGKFEEIYAAIVFIAKELFDERTSGLKHMADYHILDRVEASKSETSKDKLKVKSITRVGNHWLGFKLDSKFHYGQDAEMETRLRWLVYHPGLSGRKMYQHRFTQNTLTKIAEISIDWASDLPEHYGGAYVSRVMGGLCKFLSAVKGNPLRQFGDPGVATNKQVEEAMRADQQATPAMSLVAVKIDDKDWHDDVDVDLEPPVQHVRVMNVTGSRHQFGVNNFVHEKNRIVGQPGSSVETPDKVARITPIASGGGS